MEINMYCVWCGGMLHKEGEHVACISCATEYSNILLSETIGSDEEAVLEKSISMDCIVKKIKAPPMLEMRAVPLEKVAAD